MSQLGKLCNVTLQYRLQTYIGINKQLFCILISFDGILQSLYKNICISCMQCANHHLRISSFMHSPLILDFRR